MPMQLLKYFAGCEPTLSKVISLLHALVWNSQIVKVGTFNNEHSWGRVTWDLLPFKCRWQVTKNVSLHVAFFVVLLCAAYAKLSSVTVKYFIWFRFIIWPKKKQTPSDLVITFHWTILWTNWTDWQLYSNIIRYGELTFWKFTFVKMYLLAFSFFPTKYNTDFCTLTQFLFRISVEPHCCC